MVGNVISAASIIRSNSAMPSEQQAINSFVVEEVSKVAEVMLTGKASSIDFYIAPIFMQRTVETNLMNPITIRGDRVHIEEEKMEPEKPYSIVYGKDRLVIRKTTDGKIHVYRLS